MIIIGGYYLLITIKTRKILENEKEASEPIRLPLGLSRFLIKNFSFVFFFNLKIKSSFKMSETSKQIRNLKNEIIKLKIEIENLKSRLILNSTMLPLDPSFLTSRVNSSRNHSVTSIRNFRDHVDSLIVNKRRTIQTRSMRSKNRLIKGINNNWFRI